MKKKRNLAVLLIFLCVFLVILAVLVQKKKNDEKREAESEEKVEVTDLDEDDVTGVSFLLNGENVSFTKKDDDWICDNDSSFSVDQSKITAFLQSVEEIDAERVIGKEELVSLSEYGLETPGNVISLTEKNGQTTTITIGDQNISGNFYVYLNDNKNTVYLVAVSFDTVFPSSLTDWEEREEES